ncbi:uncharacterized protein LOC114519944 [Dendronephthya gigantea]|uniref:uncharacterized protein LOC114519944 n=1 Tax=Dendronephthya gigantea TaxID=151771 RepID=UPI00106BAC73|nr:uncharacterized protein LOC114519944 [Dendronephthya gigantea]XP_028395932.1 uncharacterized protein LOC114519944 [Dendronephthya gigantea]
MNHSSRFLIAILILALVFVANTEEDSLINRSIQVENRVVRTLPFRIRKNVDERLNFTASSTSEPSPEGDGTSEPSPEGDGTFEPSPEGDGTSEPEGDGTSEPEDDGTSEPEGEGKSEPEPQPETWPEPGPEWEKAYKLWKSAWPAHNYIFAIIFLLMAFYSGYYVVFNVKDGLRKKYLSISLNVMMFILSITRSFVLFFDPYHQGTLMKEKLILHMMWSIGTPCLLASDSLCILALAESANVNLTHQRFQRLSNILVVISLHFVLVITTDIVVSAHMSAKVMILFCQVFSVIWGSFLGFWYIALAQKMNKVLFKAAGRRKTRGDRVYLLLIYLSSAANLFTCVLIIYSAAGVFGVYSEVEFVEAWPWFTLQTGMRTSEVLGALLVFTVSAKRNRMKNKVDIIIVCGETTEGRESSDTLTTTQTLNNLHGQHLNIPSWKRPSHTSADNSEGSRSPRARKMSLFSELHETKLSATGVGKTQQRNSFLISKTSGKMAGNLNVHPTNNNVSGNGRRMSMFSQLQELKLSAIGNDSDVHVNDTVHTHGNMTEKNVNTRDEHVSDTTNTHGHVTETYENMTDGHVKDTHNVWKITRSNECRSSQRSLFAGQHGKEKLDDMKVLEYKED